MLMKVAAVLVLLAGAAQADEFTVIDADAKFPEGPFVENGILYYAQYAASEIDMWDGKTLTKLWGQEGSGANAVQRFGSGFIVACYDNNTIVLLDADGKTSKVIDKDDKGDPILGPNDIALDGKGGAYVTLSGPWESGPIIGKVLHVAADGTAKVLADDLHYANGIALSADGSTLFVVEHYANRIVQFKRNADGSLSDRRIFVHASDLEEPADALPDGIKLGPDGNLYIGLYSASRIVVVDAEGKLVRKIEVPGQAAPNLAFSEDGKTMYVTAVDDKIGAPYPGTVYALQLE